MASVDYSQLEADIVVTMLPIIYRETPQVGNMAASRERQAINRTVEIARQVVNELKGVEQ